MTKNSREGKLTYLLSMIELTAEAASAGHISSKDASQRIKSLATEAKQGLEGLVDTVMRLNDQQTKPELVQAE